MTRIRVDPPLLRRSAQRVSGTPDEVQAASASILDATQGAPGYEGQFGPEVVAAGEALSVYAGAPVGKPSALGEEATAKADTFEAADNKAPAGVCALAPPPPASPFSFLSAVRWYLDIILRLVPGWDPVDILRQLDDFFNGREVDNPVLVLAVIGLVLDVGWLEPSPADEARNAAAGVLKVVAKRLPKDPARDALEKFLKEAVEDPEERMKLVHALGALGENRDLLARVVEHNPEVLVTLLKNGPDAIRLVAKNGDLGVDLVTKVGDVGVVLLEKLASKGSVELTSEEAKDLLVRFGQVAADLVPFVPAFDGPITVRMIQPGETFVHYTNVATSRGSFLGKTIFDDADAAADALNL